jgi:2,4-didehydro-3-deoxy-L-rhamnonate hydrolase
VKLVSFEGGFGRVQDDSIVPMGSDIVTYLATGQSNDAEPISLASARLLAPVPHPQKIVCIGLNYRDHAAEQGVELPEEPILFGKFANSIVGPGGAIEIPRATTKVDYEAELGVVIGATAWEVEAADALSYVAGYMCTNDVSARDLQFASRQWTRGKAIDTFLPCGPHLTTGDEIDDPQALAIRCRIGDELMQDSNTSDMIFPVRELVSFISRTMTLEPGDLIATGTPAGVGTFRKPSRYLKAGEEVTVEIDGLGRLANPVVERA